MKMKKILGVLLALVMIVGIMPTAASAAASTAKPDEEQAGLYSYVGFLCDCGEYGGEHFAVGETADDAVIYRMIINYLGDNGDDWFTAQFTYDSGFQDGYWELSYVDYMAIANSLFTNPCEMKEYLAEQTLYTFTSDGWWEDSGEKQYNAGTDTVKINTPVGGFGDYWSWDALSVYDTIDYVYVQGLYLRGIIEDTDGLVENVDYFMSDGYAMGIKKRTELALLKTDSGYKIAGYYDIDYHITTATYTNAAGEIVEYPVLFTSDGGKYTPVENVQSAEALILFEQGVTRFDNNDGLWHEQTASITFTIKVGDGYKITSVIAEDADGSRELTEYSFGGYEVLPSGPLTLTVNTELDPESFPETDGDGATEGESNTGSSTIVISGSNGSSLTTEKNEYYTDLSLVVDEVTASEAETAGDVVLSANSNISDTVVYEIHLTDSEGNVYQPAEGDEVTITLPVPDGWNASDTMVYHVSDDGELTDMKAVASEDGKTVSFTTTHFSVFVLANALVQGNTTNPPVADTTNPQTGDNSHIALWFTLMGVSALSLFGAGCLGRKRKAVK